MNNCKTRDVYGTSYNEDPPLRSTATLSVDTIYGPKDLQPDEAGANLQRLALEAREHAHEYSMPYYSDGTETFCSTKRGYGRVNDCYHTKNSAINSSYSAAYYSKLGSRRLVQYHLWHRDIPLPLYALRADVLKHPQVDLRAAQTTAWHIMQPEFEGNVSMLNFIFELKDFKDVAKFMLKSPLKKICGAFSQREMKKLYAQSAVKRGDRVLNAAAGLHLLNQMAIKPLIKDVLSIQQSLKIVVDEAQSKFQQEGLTLNRRHYSETFVNYDDSKMVVQPNSKVGWPLHRGYRDTTKFTATLDYTYKYSTRSSLDAFKRYWGLDMSAEAFWNGLPFSFLADYFVNIGQTLHIMEHDPNVTLTEEQYCESLLTRHSEGLHIKTLSDGGQVLTPYMIGHRLTHESQLVAGTEASLYTRRSCTPNWGPVAPRFKLPSQAQNLNILALLKCNL